MDVETRLVVAVRSGVDVGSAQQLRIGDAGQGHRLSHQPNKAARKTSRPIRWITQRRAWSCEEYRSLCLEAVERRAGRLMASLSSGMRHGSRIDDAAPLALSRRKQGFESPRERHLIY